MKKKLFLIPLIASGMLLAACNSNAPAYNGGGSGGDQGGDTGGDAGGDTGGDTGPGTKVTALINEIKTFLQGRDVLDQIDVPGFSALAETDLVNYDVYEDFEYIDPYEDDPDLAGWLGTWYAPYVFVQLSGDKTASLLNAFGSSTWTAVQSESDEGDNTGPLVLAAEEPTNYVYEDSTKQVGVEFYYTEADAETGQEAGTYVSIYATYDWLYEIEYEIDSWPGDLIGEFLAKRGVKNATIPAITITDTDVEFCYEDTILMFNDWGYPCFGIGFTSEAKVNEYYALLGRTTGWTVPTTAGDFGYECISPDGLFEVDCFTGEVEEGQNVYSLTFYATSDLYGSESGGGETSTAPQELIDATEAIAMLFNGNNEYEDYYSEDEYLLIYSDYNGQATTLAAAAAEAATKLTGYTADGNAEVVKDDSGDYLSQGFTSSDGKVGAYVLTYFDTDGTSIVYEIHVFLLGEEGGEGGEDNPDETIDDNPDGSKTATFDFSKMADQTAVDSVTTSDGAVTLTSTYPKGGNQTKWYNNGYTAASLRIYKDNTLTFEGNNGVKIEKVEFTCVDTGSKKYHAVTDANLTITGGSYAVSGDNVTITATEGGVTSLSFVYTGDGHTAITSISITYK